MRKMFNVIVLFNADRGQLSHETTLPCEFCEHLSTSETEAIEIDAIRLIQRYWSHVSDAPRSGKYALHVRGSIFPYAVPGDSPDYDIHITIYSIGHK